MCVDLRGSTQSASVNTTRKETWQGPMTSTFQSHVEMGRGKSSPVKLMLLEDDGSTAVFAQSLSVRALVTGGMGHGSVQQPKAISQVCSNCSEVELPSVPAQTARLVADMRLASDTERVRLYVMSVEL